MSHPLDLASVNALDEAAFAEAFGSVFEHFPQAAAGAWAQRPFASVAALHGAMMDVVRKHFRPFVGEAEGTSAPLSP